jgi:hypothetical protein
MSRPWLEPDMGTRFGDAGFRPIQFSRLTVHPMLRLPVRAGDSISVEWLSADSPRVQGLVFRMRNPDIPGANGRGGKLRVAGTEAYAIGLWMDTAPNPCMLDVLVVKPGAQLQISNQWRTSEGRVDEWFQNYGMLIEELGDGQYELRCSDGAHPAGPNFEDQVVRIRWSSRDIELP